MITAYLHATVALLPHPNHSEISINLYNVALLPLLPLLARRKITSYSSLHSEIDESYRYQDCLMHRPRMTSQPIYLHKLMFLSGLFIYII